jgi:hypothetical protein
MGKDTSRRTSGGQGVAVVAIIDSTTAPATPTVKATTVNVDYIVFDLLKGTTAGAFIWGESGKEIVLNSILNTPELTAFLLAKAKPATSTEPEEITLEEGTVFKAGSASLPTLYIAYGGGGKGTFVQTYEACGTVTLDGDSKTQFNVTQERNIKFTTAIWNHATADLLVPKTFYDLFTSDGTTKIYSTAGTAPMITTTGTTFPKGIACREVWYTHA